LTKYIFLKFQNYSRIFLIEKNQNEGLKGASVANYSVVGPPCTRVQWISSIHIFCLEGQDLHIQCFKNIYVVELFLVRKPYFCLKAPICSLTLNVFYGSTKLMWCPYITITFTSVICIEEINMFLSFEKCKKMHCLNGFLS
jgi:hypothetical protein